MNQREYSFPFFCIPRGLIRIREKKCAAGLISAILFFILFERFLVQLGVPGAVIYIIDVVNVYLMIKILSDRSWRPMWVLVVAYAILVFASVLTAFPNYFVWNGNIVTTLLELRNILRFLIFFLACVTFLKREDIERIFKVLILFFYVNSIYIIYQYFTFHPENTWMRGDQLNGFFGTETGGNTFVNVLMLVVVAYLMNQWANGKIKTICFILPLLLSVGIAGLIELKAYFLEVAFVYIWYLLRKRKTYRQVWMNLILIVALIIVAYAALQYMFIEYPWFRETMSLQGLLSSVTDTGGYTGEQDLNRFTGIMTISKTIFHGDLAEVLFGIGLGNGSVSGFGGDGTLFSQMYADNHYSWFSNTYVFVQCGLLGVGIYIFTFLYLFFKKKYKKEYGLLVEIMALLAIFLFFYGEALKTDAGYFVYFALACGFMVSRDETDELRRVE